MGKKRGKDQPGQGRPAKHAQIAGGGQQARHDPALFRGRMAQYRSAVG